jgi:hypothetical protein
MAPDSLPIHATTPVSIQEADGWVVVAWWQVSGGNARDGHYEYHHCATENDAADTYDEYERGEYARATAVGIFPAKHGLPFGPPLDPHYVAKLMQETRRG